MRGAASMEKNIGRAEITARPIECMRPRSVLSSSNPRDGANKEAVTNERSADCNPPPRLALRGERGWSSPDYFDAWAKRLATSSQFTTFQNAAM